MRSGRSTGRRDGICSLTGIVASGRSEIHGVNTTKGNLRPAPLESVITRRKARVASTIYKICDGVLWREAERAGVFRGASVDACDGFIHFSSAVQVRATAAKHFAGFENLVLIAVDADALGAALKWEISRNGDVFPHLYGTLPLTAVLWVEPLPLGIDRRHVFPELIP
jgi:uncharacterized protein (DUF952 family)